MDTKHFDTELFKSSLAGSKVLFCSPCCSHSRKAKYNEVEENRAELVTPRLPFCFKVPVVPLAYLRPVNLTQPSSREDLGSNKGLTPRSPRLRPHWRRWLALLQPSSPHAILAPTMSFLSLPFPSFTVIPLCLSNLFFFAAFVLLLLTFFTFCPLLLFLVFFALSTFYKCLHYLFLVIPSLSFHLCLFVSCFWLIPGQLFSHLFSFFLFSLSFQFLRLRTAVACLCFSFCLLFCFPPSLSSGGLTLCLFQLF